MKYAACRVPAGPVYREPTHRSEMVNQLLFGEMVSILEEGPKIWVKIRGIMDGYEGWISGGQLEPVDERTAMLRQMPTVKQPFTLIQAEGRSMLIPFGASFAGWGSLTGLPDFYRVKGGSSEVLEKTETPGFTAQFGNFSYSYKISTNKTPSLLALTGAWLDAPYLWGGRTVLGVDCSGFAQTIYKVMGMFIPRDAHQQALEGHVIGFLQEAGPGDLAFFDDEEGKIVHVGILLSDHEIVHAAGGTGKVQIDKIDNEGIVRSNDGLRTHRLRIIKRYFTKGMGGMQYVTNQ